MNKSLETYEVRALRPEGLVEVPRGIFDRDTNACVFAPENAIRFLVKKTHVLVWRQSRPGARSKDNVWSVESYSRPSLALVWRHEVQDRAFTSYELPVSLTEPREAPDKVVTLHCASDEGPASLFLVRSDDGQIFETTNKEDALTRAGYVKPRRPQKAPPPAPTNLAGLEEVLAAPDDDEVRLRYAASLVSAGDPRGELIRLQVEKTRRPLTAAEKKAEKSLLDEHREAWGARLGATKSGQVWERGFLSTVQVSNEPAPGALTHPEWRLVQHVPGNGLLPAADLMDGLETSGGFNLAAWFGTRKSPWSKLRSLTARSKELAMLDRERFPALSRLVVFDAVGIDLVEVVTRMKLRGLELIGALDPKVAGYDLRALWSLLVSLPEVVIAPHQGLNYRATLSDGALHVVLKKNGKPAWAKGLLALVPPRALRSISFDPSEPALDVTPWLSDGRP